MKIKESLEQAIQQLKQANIPDRIAIARRILAHTLQVQKEYLITHDLQEIGAVQQQQYSCYIKEIIQGKPIQYITNQQEFMKLDFYVDENVLVPRDDTEILVEEVIDILEKEQKNEVLDLCTGSGAIGIAIAKYVKKSQVQLIDISKKALQVAKKNIEKNGVEKQVKLLESDLFENVKNTFDLIVSNPPYIETPIIKTLQKEVQAQPMLALDGGRDGLKLYKRIIQNAHQYLNKGGYLCLEIGYNQREKVIALLQKTNQYDKIFSKKDLGGKDRIVIAKVR